MGACTSTMGVAVAAKDEEVQECYAIRKAVFTDEQLVAPSPRQHARTHRTGGHTPTV